MRTILISKTYLRMRLGALAVVLAVVGSACVGGGDGDRPLVVATTTVLGDLVTAVVGDAAQVETLLPVGADPHDFEPSSRQVARVVDAELVVAVGLELEEGLEDLLASAESEGVPVLRVGPRVEPDWLGDSVVLDPHVWMDPIRMALAAELIAAELERIGVPGPWASNAATARATFERLDADIRSTLDAIPAERRYLVTSHDSLRYFATRYDLTVVGSVVEGGSTMARPSSARLAELIDEIERLGITAVFGETTEPSALLDAIAAEPGLDVVVVELHVGSLGEPGSPSGTYVGMMRENARLVAAGLTR